MLERGQKVGPYVVDSLLGVGGMGAVFRVWLESTRSFFAMKVLADEYAADPVISARFLNEARIQARLNHPNIVAVADTVPLPRGWAVVMELVQGTTLADWMEQRQVPPDEAVLRRLFAQLADGLAHVHAHGIVHRDIKPSNILLQLVDDLPHKALLLDFGIAKTPASPHATRTGALLGTPGYMSPEQIRSAKDVDAASDIFSFGAALYECATGRTAFEGASDFDVQAAIVSGRYVAPRDRRPGLSEGLSRIIERTLSPNPGARPSAAQLMAELKSGAAVVTQVDATMACHAVDHGFAWRLSPTFWSGPLGTRLSLVLPLWADSGFLKASSDQNPSVIRLDRALWEQLLAPASETEREERAVLEALVEAPPGRWLVRTESFVGASKLPVRLFRDGASVAPDELLRSEPQSPEITVLLMRLAEWNARPATPLESQLRLVSELHRLRRLAAGTSQVFELDDHLAEFEITRPEKIALAWEPSGRGESFDLKAFVPGIGGVDSLPLEGLRDSEPIISLGKKRFVELDGDTHRTLQHVRRRQQARSRRQVTELIADPVAALPPGVASDTIDLSLYSHRVVGFERVVRAARPEDIQTSGVRWFEREAPLSGEPFLSLDITSPSGGAVTLVFPTPDHAISAEGLLSKELKRSPPSPVRISDADVVPTTPLRDRLALELAVYRSGVRNDGQAAMAAPPRLAAIIDEDAVFATRAGDALLRRVPWQKLAGLLAPRVELKEHQRAGVAWLWHHLSSGCPGVLLADDMGLGKTLQVAAFLALQRAAANDRGRPTLIAMPLVLLDNWTTELERFFAPDAFGRIVRLHGAALEAFRRGSGLDIASLGAADVVLTTYETLARYQIDLLKVDWQVVVLDEAHAIKNPDALRSRAACGLKRRFAICVTGTPVENRLLDLWSQFFFLSPRQPFPPRAEFARTYEAGADTKPVREVLAFPSETSRVLRRSKKVLDLPPKHEHEHTMAMSAEQVALERRIARMAESGGGGAFKTLGLLRKLYAHPWLLLDDPAREWRVRDAIAASPKLERCLELIGDVQARGEKLIVFCLSLQMQALLQESIRQRTGLPAVQVINGSVNQSGRAALVLDEFSRRPGFNALVLSPLAAGVGLNITAANHVIHFERWWNPAKEDQATDRAYRIGQTRPVHVHQLILHHPGNDNAGFDRKLHALVSAKRRLARDFLAPADGLEIQPQDILRILEGEP